MSAFDIQISLGGINVLVQEGEDVRIVELALLVALPVGPGQAIPLGQVRVPMTVEAVDDLLSKLTEARTHMSAKPNITVVNSLQGVEEAAAFQRKLTS